MVILVNLDVEGLELVEKTVGPVEPDVYDEIMDEKEVDVEEEETEEGERVVEIEVR